MAPNVCGSDDHPKKSEASLPDNHFIFFIVMKAAGGEKKKHQLTFTQLKMPNLEENQDHKWSCYQHT